MHRPIRRSALLAAALTAAAAFAIPASATERATMIEQLRIYEIFDGNKEAFHARFRDHAARIMKIHGFDIAAMWEAKGKDRTEFVYVLRWPDEATMRERWARFMQDAEWSRIKDSSAAEHGRMVGAIEERVMQRTSYSP
ncbi:NIPSNAP family protein [Bosea vestrisii]|uniref:NIPSNAP family protein n=1 Tax=Bosea vestrisii TaxID=151416 RepID=UPI0024DFB541|nr:NIPSNAP family protein [Bosea vestrisii]WID97884.1 NIPSNAP family protein [Bosea vestrisii]